MLQFLNNLPENTVGLEVEGEVTKDQYDSVVVPKMEELAKRQGEINYLIILKSGIDSFTAGVWWDDFKMAIKHFNKWKKVAIVSDQSTVRTVTNLFGFTFPGEHRLFQTSQLEEAKSWLAAD